MWKRLGELNKEFSEIKIAKTLKNVRKYNPNVI